MNETSNNEIILLHRKKKKNIFLEIYRYQQTTVKRFIKTASFPDMRKVWEMEHKALQKLSGLPVPNSYGFKINKLKGAKEIIYIREFIEGETIENFTTPDMKPLATIMARIHERGVITRDPAPENFIRATNGEPVFIDFGRAALLNPKNPLIIYYVGKELARVHHHALQDSPVLYKRFYNHYMNTSDMGPVKTRLANFISRIWYKRISRRQFVPYKNKCRNNSMKI